MIGKQVNFDKIGNYLMTFLKVHPEISKTNYLIKLIVNFLYLIILGHLITRLFLS
jgi:hypothetical protein